VDITPFPDLAQAALHLRTRLDGGDFWFFAVPASLLALGLASGGLVWSALLGAGLSEPTPLVHDGLMFVPQAAGVVQAFNAATGDLVWSYAKRFEASPDVGLPSRMRSLAIYGDRIYVATPDAHIVALEAATGAVAWDHTVADYKLGYRYTSGPIVARGRIVAGMTGCERYKNDVCFISAHDPRTGDELWRTSTIARPGEPGGDTWGPLPLTLRAGGDAWIPGTYDPRANLIYWSVAQAKPWARISRGTDGDALYTNSTLAIAVRMRVRINMCHSYQTEASRCLESLFPVCAMNGATNRVDLAPDCLVYFAR